MVCASSLQTMLFSYYLKSNDRAKKPKLPKPFLSFDLMCVFFSAFIYIQQHVRDTPYTYLRWNNHLTECEMHNFCALDFYHDHFIYGPVFRKFYTNELWIMALTVIAFKKQTLLFNRWRIHLRVHQYMHILHNQFARWKLIKYIISLNNIRDSDRNFSEKLFLTLCLHC